MSVSEAAARIRDRLDARVQERVTEVMNSAMRFHMNAPRGGINTNMFGQRRSAPGEQPAIETGELLSAILAPERGELRGSVVVNRANLEWGEDGEFGRVEPRPMGRMVLAEIKAGGQW